VGTNGPKNLLSLVSVKQIPTNRLLVETDTPYLAPGQYKGQNNKPEFIVETAKKLAELKEMTLQILLLRLDLVLAHLQTNC